MKLPEGFEGMDSSREASYGMYRQRATWFYFNACEDREEPFKTWLIAASVHACNSAIECLEDMAEAEEHWKKVLASAPYVALLQETRHFDLHHRPLPHPHPKTNSRATFTAPGRPMRAHSKEGFGVQWTMGNDLKQDVRTFPKTASKAGFSLGRQITIATENGHLFVSVPEVKKVPSLLDAIKALLSYLETQDPEPEGESNAPLA